MDVRIKKAEEAKKTRQTKEQGATAEQEEETKEAEEPPVEEKLEPVELDEEEKKVVFPKTANPDVAERTLAKGYANFSVPGLDEGFAEVKYVWADGSAAAEIMNKYILEQKVLQKAEDLVPGEMFKD